MAYGGLDISTPSPTVSGGYQGLTAPTTPIAQPATPEPLSGLGYAAAPLVSAAKGAMQGYQGVPETPKNGQFIGTGFNDAMHATIDAFSNAIKQGSENLSAQTDVIQKQIAQHGSLGLEGDIALGKTIVGSIGTVFGAALSPLQGLATVPGVGHAVDFVNKLFGAIGEGSGQGAVQILNETPLSQEHKNALAPLVHDAASLAGQIAAGKLSDVGIGALKDKVVQVADTLHSQIQGAKAATEIKQPTVAGESVTEPVPVTKVGYQGLGKPVEAVPSEGLPSTGTNLTVIRHGETANNAQGLNRGMIDVPLNETGRADATRIAPSIKEKGVDTLISSDLGRAKETAQIISKETGIPITETSQALRPWDLGKFSGKDIKETLPVLQDYMKNKPDEPIDGGESFNQFKDRTIQGVKDLMQKYPDKHIGLVTHHRVERLLDAYITAGVKNEKIDISKMMVQGAEPGSATALKLEPKAGRTTQTLKPIKGTGELKARGLSESVEATAIEKKLTDTLGDLPEYRQVSMADQARKAAELITSDPESARAIAMGEKAPPKDVLPESVFVAVEHDAITKGDAQTLMDLANSKLSASATTMGQRIRTLGERDTASPINAIKAVQEARATALKAKGVDIAKETAKETAKIKEEVKSAVRASRPKWEDFINSITCGY